MSAKDNQWMKHDRARLEREVQELGTFDAVSKKYGAVGSFVDKAAAGHNPPVLSPRAKFRDANGKITRKGPVSAGKSKAERPGVKIEGDKATLISHPNPTGIDLLTPEDLLRQHGIDPEDGTYEATTNCWNGLTGNGGITVLHQLKVVFKKKVRLDLIIPCYTKGWVPRKAIPKVVKGKAEMHVLFTDTHNPHINRGLEDIAGQFLKRHQPASWNHLGDGMNFAKPSRHRETPEHSDTPAQCVISLHDTLAFWTAQSPDSVRRYFPGNHCLRVRNAIIDKLPDLRELADEFMSIPVMLRLDQLGIEYIVPQGEYHESKFTLVQGTRLQSGLVLMHGTKTGKHGGALKAQDRRESSIAQGHDHTAAITCVVRYDSQGRAVQHWAISVSAMCERNMGYMDDDDTAQGFTTITVHPDGRWHPELAIYDENTQTLTWRDELYTANAA